jgi:transcriptional regulator with XRE-family HTH domain
LFAESKQVNAMRKQSTPTKSSDLSLYIKKLAKEHKVSLRQVSIAIEVAPSYLSEVLSGRKRPSPQLLAALAKFFEVPKVDVYTAAGWLTLSDDEQRAQRFNDFVAQDSNFLELFEILINLPEVERRRNVRLLLALTKERTEEPPLGWTETLPDGTVQTYIYPDAEERDKAYQKKSGKSGTR